MKPVLHKVSQMAIGSQVKVSGWVESVRKMKNVAFIDLQDGSQSQPLNVVFDKPSLAESLSTGTGVEIAGTLKHSPGNQPIELVAEAVRVLGEAGADYPLQKKYHSREFLRQLPQFRWKTRQQAEVLRYRSWALTQLHDYFAQNDVTQVNSPLLTSSDCEGAGEVFELKGSSEFFGKPVYLTVSSQLHLEVYAAALSRVWNLTPAFRAEASDTNRHLSEFWMVEVELSFIESLGELAQFCEKMVKSVVPTGPQRHALLNSKRDAALKDKLIKRWELLSGKWTTLSYTEALEQLNKAASMQKVSSAVEWGTGIPSEHEKYLAASIGTPVVVTDYPASIKPFYMKSSEEHASDSRSTVACFDVLIPELGEIVGGSLRENSYETLKSRMSQLNMDIDSMNWYLDLRKYGSVPHGGYGLGFERLIMYICGLENIRDAIGFIRGAGNCQC